MGMVRASSSELKGQCENGTGILCIDAPTLVCVCACACVLSKEGQRERQIERDHRRREVTRTTAGTRETDEGRDGLMSDGGFR